MKTIHKLYMVLFLVIMAVSGISYAKNSIENSQLVKSIEKHKQTVEDYSSLLNQLENK